nr:uncharacterized protein LOC112035356 [Quercus suber]
MEAKGRASGLCIMWKARVSIKVVEFDKNVIAVKVSDSVTDWLLVGFYGLPYYSKKKKAWGNLFALLESHQGPWACIGDFNYIMNEDEQVRGCEGSSSAINYLKELMFEYDAVNLGYSGNKFIWAKDHAPIMLDTNPSDTFAHRPFRFKAVWLRDDGCRLVIEKAWNMDKIKEIQNRQPSKNNEVAEQALQTELSEWLIRSEVLWQQKSRELWLKLGDKNSRFFHLSTVIHRRNNNVDAIKKEDGTWIYESNQIRKPFRDTFMELFKEEEISFPEHLEHLVLPCITKEENVVLEKISSLKEIKVVLFEMQDLKAPGLDGLALFYKQLWPMVGNDLIKAVTSFFTRGTMPKEEILHSFKSRKTKPGLMAVKLDLQKAYDRVNWKFIQAVLLHFGFNEVFTGWVIACVSSVSFEVLVNRGKTECFKPSRGLRQGDTLSPYLFILRQEILSRLIDHELKLKKINDIKTSISGPTITHVMYADDILMFSKASRRDAACLSQTKRSVKNILQVKSLKKDVVYLGAPMFLSRAPSKDFSFLQDKLEAKLMGWRSKCLSWAGRKTLINSVAKSIPNYTMSTFSIPNKVCDRLDSLTRSFNWINRSGNCAAYSIAKFALDGKVSCFFNSGNKERKAPSKEVLEDASVGSDKGSRNNFWGWIRNFMNEYVDGVDEETSLNSLKEGTNFIVEEKLDYLRLRHGGQGGLTLEFSAKAKTLAIKRKGKNIKVFGVKKPREVISEEETESDAKRGDSNRMYINNPQEKEDFTEVTFKDRESESTEANPNPLF